jgi:hypothetical protein
MRLDTFLLADAATAPPDGKLYIHGGGLTVIRAPITPISVPLSLAIRLEIEERELHVPHVLRLSILAPDGNSVWPAQELGFGPMDEPQQVADGEERYIQLALSFGALTFESEGVYTFSLAADGETLREMAVPVVVVGQHRPDQPPPNRAERRRQARGG